MNIKVNDKAAKMVLRDIVEKAENVKELTLIPINERYTTGSGKINFTKGYNVTIVLEIGDVCE